MAIEYEFHTEGDILLVKTSGFDENLQDVMEYGLAIIQAARESGAERVLCDERELEYQLNTFDTYESAEFIASQAPQIAKVAIVCSPDVQADADFWETVAVNRGMRVRMFLDLEKARRWVSQ